MRIMVDGWYESPTLWSQHEPRPATKEEAGIDARRQRVGPLPLVPRATLEACWPELLPRLEARYGPRWR